MKTKYVAKQAFEKTIHQLLAKGIIPVDIFYQGISSLGEFGFITSKQFSSRNQFISFFLQNVLDQVDEIDKKMEVLIAENQNAKEDEEKKYDDLSRNKKCREKSVH